MSTLQANVYNQIREHLLGGQWKSGKKLSELKLATDLGVNRNPVHEALLRLSAEGLLERQAGIGCRVPKWDIKVLTEMYQLREALEGQASRLAVQEASRAQLVHLEEKAEEFGRLAEQGQECKAAEIDNRFHRHLVELGGNRVLVRVWESNHIQVVFRNELWRESHKSRPIPKRDRGISIRAHHRIVAALKVGDPDEAEAAARDHVRFALAGLIELHTISKTLKES